MKLEIPKCPECGLLATGIGQNIPAVAYLDTQDDGTAEYSEGCRIDWNGQTTVFDDEHRAMLTCPKHHVWPSKIFHTNWEKP